MPRKLKFNPEITRVKLNPEQAVLQCSCYDATNTVVEGATDHGSANAGCNPGLRTISGFIACTTRVNVLAKYILENSSLASS